MSGAGACAATDQRRLGGFDIGVKTGEIAGEFGKCGDFRLHRSDPVAVHLARVQLGPVACQPCLDQPDAARAGMFAQRIGDLVKAVVAELLRQRQPGFDHQVDIDKTHAGFVDDRLRRAQLLGQRQIEEPGIGQRGLIHCRAGCVQPLGHLGLFQRLRHRAIRCQIGQLGTGMRGIMLLQPPFDPAGQPVIEKAQVAGGDRATL